MTKDLVPAELIPVEMPSPLPPVKKMSYYVPLAAAPCETCRETVVYNMAAGVLQHEDASHDTACASPWPDVRRENT